jgi:hypothetical protein
MITVMLIRVWVSYYLLVLVAIPTTLTTTEAFQVRRHYSADSGFLFRIHDRHRHHHPHHHTTTSCLYGKKKKGGGGGGGSGSRKPQYQEKQSVKEARFGMYKKMMTEW